MPEKKKKRKLPGEESTRREFTRRDTLRSFQQFGKVDSTSLANLDRPAPKPKQSFLERINPFAHIERVLKRARNAK